MTYVLPDEIDAYAAEHTTPSTDLLPGWPRDEGHPRRAADAHRHRRGPVPRVLVYATQAKRVLEFGTYSGYSSISMAAALPLGGHIDTCEIDEKHASVAQRYIDEAGYSDRITIHLGPAVETVERLEGEFDFVFIDADKPNYVNYYEAVLPRLSERGLIAADNTLWSGRVLDESDDSDGTTAIRAFNEHVRRTVAS
jgi:caffeoyl-CoA O-methyltransferase